MPISLGRRANFFARTIGVLTIGPACLVAYWLGVVAQGGARQGIDSSHPQVNSTEQLVVGSNSETKIVNIGDVWETSTYDINLRVANGAPNTITIDKFVSGCNCTRVEPTSLTLGRGQSATVTATLDLAYRLPYQLGVEKREFEVWLTPEVGSGQTVAPGWKIRGVVRARASLSTGILQFADLCVRHGRPIGRSVRCTIHQPGLTPRALFPPDFGTAKVMPADGTGREFDITISPNPSLGTGPFAFAVPIELVGPAGAVERGPVLRVEGEMGPPFVVVPRQILLGEHGIGTVVEGEFSIKLPAGTSYVVRRVEVDSEDADVSQSRPQQEGTVAYTVRQTVTAPSDQSVNVRVVLVDAQGREEQVVVVVRYYGITAGHRVER